MITFKIGEEVMFKGERVKVVSAHNDLYVVQKQPGSVLMNVPYNMLIRPPIPPSPEDDPIARIEAGIANVNTQLKGIRELLSKRMPKKRRRD